MDPDLGTFEVAVGEIQVAPAHIDNDLAHGIAKCVQALLGSVEPI